MLGFALMQKLVVKDLDEFQETDDECSDLNFNSVNTKYIRNAEDKATRLNFAVMPKNSFPNYKAVNLRNYNWAMYINSYTCML